MVAGWKGLSVVAALVLVGAVSFTLVAAYQWAGRLGQPRWPRAIGKATFGKVTSGTPYSPSSSGWFGFMANNNTRNVGT